MTARSTRDKEGGTGKTSETLVEEILARIVKTSHSVPFEFQIKRKCARVVRVCIHVPSSARAISRREEDSGNQEPELKNGCDVTATHFRTSLVRIHHVTL